MNIDYLDLDIYFENISNTIFIGRPVVEEKDLEILRVLLSKKGITRYRLGRELVGQYSTAWREVSKLKERGLIEVTQIRERGKQTVPHIELSNLAIRALLVRARSTFPDIHKELDSKLSDLFREIKRNYPEFLPTHIRKLSTNFLQLFYPLYSMAGSLSPTRLQPILFRIALIDSFLALLNAKKMKKTSTIYVILERKKDMVSIHGDEEAFMIRYIDEQLQAIKGIFTSSSLELDEQMSVKLDEQAYALGKYK